MIDKFINLVLRSQIGFEKNDRERRTNLNKAQVTPYRDASIIDINNHDKPDILLAGNFYPNNIQKGEYDGDYGSVLINKDKGNFEYAMLNGVVIKGEVRHIRKINTGKQEAYILVRNNDSTIVIKFK